MAEQQKDAAVLDQNQFCCSVCLDLLTEPVTLPCGHSYCKSCIKGCWDQGEEKGKYSCPQCRETFNLRPQLRRNNMLAEVVETLKKSSTQQASPHAAAADVDCAGPADVPCDFCSENKPKKATMSCLTCLASYCPAHIKPHHSVPVLKTHQLVSATVPLQNKMCTKHNKLMEVYCQTDKKCICYLCIVDEHKTHQTVSAAAQRAVEQKQLLVNQKEVQKSYKKREKNLKKLVQAMMDFKKGSQTTLKTSDEIFDELITSIKKKRSLVKDLMKAQEKTAIAQAEKLQAQLGEEITKLRTRHTELRQLSHVDDHIHFIQSFRSLSSSCPDLSPAPVVCPPNSFKTLTDCLSKLGEDVESLLNNAWPRITATVSTIDVVLPPVPKTREEFLRYCCPLTLDQNSVCGELSISQEYRRVTSEDSTVPYYDPYGQQSLVRIGQVLCREGLSQRCYWEVTFSGCTWSVAVSYKDISGQDFGNNKKSWSLDCSPDGYSFRHNSKTRTVSGPRSSMIGVYLDYHSGTLSFYSISGTMTLLHKESTTFTQPLYPGLMLRDYSSQSTRGYYAQLVKLW
ncbi:E3 ubiquitin/ISG15 ligase TRIM25-like [Chaetodon trifascialis]|uniref:E3 ubiquitin/ISG15 ligase TRIM25-like n=1 Tax=Chaetodon trifascialis TaxID=109706 RepID=UPI003994CA5B